MYRFIGKHSFPVKNYEPRSVTLSLQGNRTYLSLWAES